MRAKLREAILAGFDPTSLDQVLRDNDMLRANIAIGPDFATRVNGLIDVARQEGWLTELCGVLAEARAGNQRVNSAIVAVQSWLVPNYVEGLAVKLPRRQFLQRAAGVAALPTLSRVARAQTYPARPITIVIGYAAGGPTDTRVRILAQHMRATLGQSVIVENMTGASGSLAIARIGRAAPDGYTLSSGDWGTHVVAGAVYTLQHDLLSDFEPIALLSSTPLLVLASNAVPAMDLMELIAWLKANSAKTSFGTSGPGSPSHAGGLLLQKLTGTQVQYVPYRGGAPVLQALIASQIDVGLGALSTSLPAVREGKIKAYAVTSNARSPAAPDIATVDEAGLPGLHLSLWGGLWAPKGTSKVVIGMLNAAVVEALADQTVRQRLTDLGETIPPRTQQTPEALAAHHKAEIEKWWPILKAAGIKGE